MKVRILIVAIVLFSVFASCKRDEIEVIPNDIMRKILVECAFMDSYSKYINTTQRADSLSFFEPIFNRYNYTVDDFEFTLEELARRKSNVLEVLINEAVQELDVTRSVAEIRNDLNIEWIKRALDSTKIVIYQSFDTIVLKSLDSLHNTYIDIPVDKKGSYEIKYRYMIDSLDKNNVRYLHYHVRDSISEKDNNSSTKWLKFEQDSALWLTHKIDITKVGSTSNQIRYELIYFGNKNKHAKKISMYFDSIEVIYYHPEKVASRLFMDRELGAAPFIKLYDDIMVENYIQPLKYGWMVKDTLVLDTMALDTLAVGSLVMDSLVFGNMNIDSMELSFYSPIYIASGLFMDRLLDLEPPYKLFDDVMERDTIVLPEYWRAQIDSISTDSMIVDSIAIDRQVSKNIDKKVRVIPWLD